MNTEKTNDYKIQRAKDQIKKIRAFYIHLAIFIVVMLVITILYARGVNVCFICFNTEHELMNLFGFLPWAFFLVIQGLIAFKKIGFVHRWEERKIKEFMEE